MKRLYTLTIIGEVDTDEEYDTEDTFLFNAKYCGFDPFVGEFAVKSHWIQRLTD